MPSNFGINVNVSSEATAPFKIKSTTSIGIAGKIEGIQTLFKKYASIKEAKTDLKGKTGSIPKSLLDIENQGGDGAIFISAAQKAETALAKFETAKTEFESKPDFVIATGHCAEPGFFPKMATLSEKLGTGTICIFDLNAKNEIDAKKEMKNISGKRIFPVFQSDIVIIEGEKEEKRPLSAMIAGLFIREDAKGEFGFSNSPSMRSLYSPIRGGVEFVHGRDCLGDRLRKEGINCAINDQGFRLWGDSTADREPIWSKVVRVRIFDRIENVFYDNLRIFIDKKMKGASIYIIDAVETFLRKLQTGNALSGFEVSLDEQKNTKEEIANGRLAINTKTQEMPTLNKLTIDLAYTDKFSQNAIGG